LEPTHLEDFLDHLEPIIRYREWEEDPNDSALVVGKQIWRPLEWIKLNRDYMMRNTFPAVCERFEGVTILPFHDAI
jgi:hypothetical protein